MINQNPNQQGIVAGLPQQNDPNNTIGKMATAGGEGVASTGSVNQTADAYRGRIPELQKKYQMTQDLIYLLAMQQLKSEKEASMRSVAMKANVPPETIMAQRDKEVSDLTGAQMKHIAGVGAEAGATQAKQKQQMAQQKMMQGIGGAPNQTQYAAGGGLVSFVNGGQATDSGAVTTGMELEKWRQEARDMMTPAEMTAYDNFLAAMRGEEQGSDVALTPRMGTPMEDAALQYESEGKEVIIIPKIKARIQKLKSGGERYAAAALQKQLDHALETNDFSGLTGSVYNPINPETGGGGIGAFAGDMWRNTKEMGSNIAFDPKRAWDALDVGPKLAFDPVRAMDFIVDEGGDFWNGLSPNQKKAMKAAGIALTWTPMGRVGKGLWAITKGAGMAIAKNPKLMAKIAATLGIAASEVIPYLQSMESGVEGTEDGNLTGDGTGNDPNLTLEEEDVSKIPPQMRNDEVPPTAEVQEGIASVAQPESKGMTLEDMLAFQQGGDKKLTNAENIIAALKGMGGSGRGGALSGIGAGLDYEQERTDKANTLEAAKRTAALGAFGDQQERLSAESLGMENVKAENRRTDIMEKNNTLLNDLKRLQLDQAQEEKITALAIEWAKIDTERFGQAMEPYINQRNKIIERMRDSDDKEEYDKWEGELDNLFVEVRNLQQKLFGSSSIISYEDL
tara:strand:+ start:28 stop:2061 length:2034 start_codon:yes stop_codon:yes gene_type:complete